VAELAGSSRRHAAADAAPLCRVARGLPVATTPDRPSNLKSSVGQLTFCASARADALANRGTGCTNCARPDLWGAWLGNRWAYPDTTTNLQLTTDTAMCSEVTGECLGIFISGRRRNSDGAPGIHSGDSAPLARTWRRFYSANHPSSSSNLTPIRLRPSI